MAQQYGGYDQGGYGQRNPYDQRDAYGAQNGGRGGQNGGYDGYGQTEPYRADMEMQPLNGPYAQQPATRDPNAILNDCQEVDRSIEQIENDLVHLQTLHKRSLNTAETDSRTTREIDALSSDIMAAYRVLVNRVRRIKGMADAGSPRNRQQVGKVDRRLKATIHKYQTLETEFRRAMQEQTERQYRIVRPDATEAEVREACEESNPQIFQQALLSSDRRGQAQSALREVSARHDAIQKIERQMNELAQLFQDLEAIVVQQEPAVQNIELKAEEVYDNINKGNQNLGGAIGSARRARKIKWISFCIVLWIIIILGAALGGYFATRNK